MAFTEITAHLKGVSSYQAGGKQPATGFYKVRVLTVEDEKPSETGEASHKITLQVVESVKDPTQIGKTFFAWITPPQGRAAAYGKRTAEEAEKDREGTAKQWLVGTGADPKIVDPIKGTTSWGLNRYYHVDPATKQVDMDRPKEAYVFYEAMRAGDDDSKSYKTFLTAQQYKGGLDGTFTVQLRNEGNTAGAGRAGGAPGIGGGRDPLADIDAATGGAASSGASAQVTVAVADDPLAGL